MRQQIKSHISPEINKQTESVEDTLKFHNNQIETSLENIAACITIMDDNMKNQICSYGNIEHKLQKLQAQQTPEKADIKQKIVNLRNMNNVIAQSTPLSDTPRFQEPIFHTKPSPLREIVFNQEHARQEQ